MDNSNWPLWNVRIRTPRLEMTVVREADLGELVEVAKAGIHDPSEMPFEDPWTDQPSPQFEYSMYQFIWRSLGSIRISLALGYERDGTAVTRRRDGVALDMRFAMDTDGWANSPGAELGTSVDGVGSAVRSMLGC